MIDKETFQNVRFYSPTQPRKEANLMRNRLIELFKKTDYKIFPNCTISANLANQFSEYALNDIVDKFLEKGVIVPLCKKGDTVYVVDYTQLGNMMFECTIEEISHCSYGTYYHLNWGLHIPRFKACKEDSFGKTVFLTREEAEKALKERKEK